MYLQERFPHLKRPYSAAIVCYALALSNHGCMKSKLLNLASRGTQTTLSFTFCQQLSNRYCFVSSVSLLLSFIHLLLSTDRTHWPDSDNRYFTLEATGYALLALIKGGHMNEAMAPFRWLNEQREIGGSYGPTQVKTFLLIEMTY